MLTVTLGEISSWLCYKTFQQTDVAHISGKIFETNNRADDLDATRAIRVHTNLGSARYFSSFYCGRHVAGVLCALKSRYIPSFTSTRLADKYAQADASWKHALAHSLIIFCTCNFSASLQFTRRRNEFSYFSATVRPGQCTYHFLYVDHHSSSFVSLQRSSFFPLIVIPRTLKGQFVKNIFHRSEPTRRFFGRVRKCDSGGEKQ